jgi:[acyl-carrier-protein] S-malonyltransferase
VAAGPLEGLAALKAEPPAKARVMPLSVAGAFHTPFMASAREELEGLVGGLRPADPSRLLLSNADGAAVGSGAEALRRLVSQVTSPVRFDACLATLRDLGVSAVIELPPAGTLAGLVKRELKGDSAPEIVTLNTPDDLPAARDLIARHGEPARLSGSAEPGVGFRVSVAPTAGSFQRGDLAEGAAVKAGQVIGRVIARKDTTDVTAHASGVLVEWLAHDEDPVAPGQPLARFAKTGEHA